MNGRLDSRQASFAQAQGVLEDNDRVVDKQAETQGQRPQGQHVDGDLEKINKVEGDQNREADGAEDQQGRFDAPQDEENQGKNHGQDDAHEQIELVEALVDLLAFIVDNPEDQVTRHISLDLFELQFDIAGDLQGAGPFFFMDNQADRRLAVDPVDIPDFAEGALDPGDVPELDGHAPLLGDDQTVDLGQAAERARDLEQEFLVSFLDLPGRIGLVPAVQGHQDLVGMDIQCLGLFPVQSDPDLRVGAAQDFHSRDTLHRSQAVFELLSEHFPQFLERVVAGYRVVEKIGRPEVLGNIGDDLGTVGGIGKLTPDPGYPFHELEPGELHVGVRLELADDRGQPDRRGGLDLLDALDGRSHLLDRRRDLSLDDLGRHVAPVRLDRDLREILLGGQLERDVEEGIDSQDGQGQEDHDRGDRPLDKDSHDRFFSLLSSTSS